MSEILLAERDGAVVVVTMNRPQVRNALDWRLFDALTGCFADVGGDDGVGAVVLTGAGGAFSSGGDLNPPEPSGLDFETSMRRFGEASLAIVRCPKPVVAAVEGVAAGAGMSLMLACDLAVAGASARLGMVFIRRGLTLDCGASWLLPRAVGPRRAKELALLGDWVDAAAAERIGLVNRVVDDGGALDTAREWAHRIAAMPTAAAATIRGIDEAGDVDLPAALEREALDQVRCASSPEARTAIEAFLRR